MTSLQIRQRILDAAFKLAFGTKEQQDLGRERIPKLLEELSKADPVRTLAVTPSRQGQ